MDMTAASALATYDYLNTLRTAGRSAAVLEALAQAYTHQDTPLAGASADPDVLALAERGDRELTVGGQGDAEQRKGGGAA